MIILNIFYKNIALKLSIFLFLFLAIISYNHIYKINEVLNLSVNIIGIIGWLAFCSSLFASINKDRYFVLSVFLLLITIGSLLGPYLEVPSDPIEHLKRTYSFCDKFSYEIKSRNYGLIHYSMSSIFLCNKILFNSNIVILKINILHGIYFAFLGSSLFLISLNAGLKIKWCFLCLMVMVLFFGTNKFSYFSYYTFAPSCTSIIIYWLWISNFYFKSGIKIFIFGTILFLISLPILWVNHIQEAVFICLVFFIWVILNFYYFLNKIDFGNKFILNTIFIILLFIIFFESTEIKFLKLFIRSFFINTFKNKEFIYENVYVFGNLNGWRIKDTLGLIGFLPLFLIFVIYCKKYTEIDKNLTIRSYLLSVTPFLVFFTPLLSYIWINNVERVTIYRIVYSSLFCLTISIFFQGFENVLLNNVKGLIYKFKLIKRSKIILMVKNIFYLSVLIVIIQLSAIRSPPIYGKLDFLMLDNKPWWPDWEIIINDSIKNKKYIITDSVTGMILKYVFDLEVNVKRRNVTGGPKIDLNYLDNLNVDNKYNCIINLIDINDSWVPIDTGHWRSNISHTSKYYTSNIYSSDEIKDKNFKINNCIVYNRF